MALESMCTAFLKKFIPDFVEDRRMTLTDIAERSMKKGKAAEQVTGKMTTIFVYIGSCSGEEVITFYRLVHFFAREIQMKSICARFLLLNHKVQCR